MGIRFYCPKGHKLNVKAFLAGKRGICPLCGERFRIPDTNQIPENAPKVRLTPEISAGRSAAGDAVVGPSLEEEVARPVVHQDRLVSASPDPLDAVPDVHWYVRPPSGGQYGPAGSEVLRRWIEEGRVCADCLIWREGWTDWKLAGPVLPGLDQGPPQATPPPAAPWGGEVSPEVRELVRSRRRSSGLGKSIALVILLGLLVVVLLVVLVLVLR